MDAIAVSHIAIGVRDMERSIAFYRDLLGLRVTRDVFEDMGGAQALFREGQPPQRHAVYLRWAEGPHATFIVLSQTPGTQEGQALHLDQLGFHHVAFWVRDVQAIYAKLQAGGVKVLISPSVSDTAGYGEAPGGQVTTMFVEDPDGNILQFDQRL